MTKVVDCFIFCNDYERELLLLKLTLESPCVDFWVGTECVYTYRGDYKGPILYNLIHSDERFAPYRDRITVLSLRDSLCDPVRDPTMIDPPEYHRAEVRLREAPTQALLDALEDHDRIIVSDVDEMVDFTCPWRRNRFFEELGRNAGEPVQFERVRYITEPDNRAFRQKMDMVTPCFTVGNIRRGEAKLSDKKWVGRAVPNPRHDGRLRPLIFEYAFMFPREAISYKYSSSLHTKWREEDIDASLECNHWTMASYQKVDFGNRWHWFERVPLTEYNSPAYVRENLESLKTGLVPEDYRERRLARYNYVAHFPDNERDC